MCNVRIPGMQHSRGTLSDAARGDRVVTGFGRDEADRPVGRTARRSCCYCYARRCSESGNAPPAPATFGVARRILTSSVARALSAAAPSLIVDPPSFRRASLALRPPASSRLQQCCQVCLKLVPAILSIF